jgi:high-affinity Fe2+/Pb2+ permease
MNPYDPPDESPRPPAPQRNTASLVFLLLAGACLLIAGIEVLISFGSGGTPAFTRFCIGGAVVFYVLFALTRGRQIGKGMIESSEHTP